MKLILASASPRRGALLLQAGFSPAVEPSQVEETITSRIPAQVVMELSRQKAEDVAARHKGEWAMILGADTVVSADGRILGKPRSQEEAVSMLQLLQGRSHQVYTGVTMICCGESGSWAKEDPAAGNGDGYPMGEALRVVEGRRLTLAERTEVFVYPMTREEIVRYVETGEPMDKAGAYGIQGRFAAYVRGIFGDYNNVVGLPVGRVCQELFRFSSSLVP